MATLYRFTQAFMALSAGITAMNIVQAGGGGRFLLTLIAAVMVASVAPYLGALAAMRRLPLRWGLAVGIAACVFGAVDVAVRTQAFNFPTERSDGSMALWLPIYSLVAIPVMAVLSYAAVTAVTPVTASSDTPSPH